MANFNRYVLRYYATQEIGFQIRNFYSVLFDTIDLFTNFEAENPF